MKKAIRTLFVFFSAYLVSLNVMADVPKADSLLVLLKSLSPKEHLYADILNQAAFELREVANERALLLAEQAQEISTKLNYIQGYAHALANIAWIYYRMDNLSESLLRANQALQMSRQIGDTLTQVSCYNNIASVYAEQQEYALSISMLRKAADIAKAFGNYDIWLRSINNLTGIFILQENPDSAYFYGKIALTERYKAKSNYYQTGALRNWGDVLVLKKSFDKARHFHDLCIGISEKFQYNYFWVTSMNKSGNIYLLKNEKDSALFFFDKVVKYCQPNKFPSELALAYQHLNDIYVGKKDFIKAHYYLSLLVPLKDSLAEMENDKHTKLLRKQFEIERDAVYIASLEKDKALKEKELERKRIYNTLLITISFSLAVGSLFLLFNYIQKQKSYQLAIAQSEKIRKQNEEIHIAKEEIRLQAENLQEINKLKDKILAIISHDFRNPISNLKSILDLLSYEGVTQEEFTSLTKNIKKSVDVLSITLDNVLHWAYSQIYGIKTNKVMIDMHTLVNKKLMLIEPNAVMKQIALENLVQIGIRVWADEEQINIVIRNLLTNAIKFTEQKGKIVVSTDSVDEYVSIAVSDTGVGMNQEKIAILFDANIHTSTKGTEGEKGSGLGLLLCKEFVEINGGKIWAESTLGKGTTIRFTLPTAP